jgi:translation elongation factor EF-1alpha
VIKPVGDVAPWWEGGTFMTTLDELPELERNKTAPLRLPILSKYKVHGAQFCAITAQLLRNYSAIL